MCVPSVLWEPSAGNYPQLHLLPCTLREPTHGKNTFLPLRITTIAFENFKDFAYPVTTLETNLVLLVTISVLLHLVQALFRVRK